MDRLPDTSVEDLQRALNSVDRKTPAMRLIAAIAYKNGVTQSALADWFDVERKTIYNWLTRFEERDVESAIRDDHRTGRPRKLSDDQLDKLESILQHPPTDVGFDAPAWTTALVQDFISERFDTEYSRPSCRRLLREAGLRYQTPRSAAADADADDPVALEAALQDLGHVWIPT